MDWLQSIYASYVPILNKGCKICGDISFLYGILFQVNYANGQRNIEALRCAVGLQVLFWSEFKCDFMQSKNVHHAFDLISNNAALLYLVSSWNIF